MKHAPEDGGASVQGANAIVSRYLGEEGHRVSYSTYSKVGFRRCRPRRGEGRVLTVEGWRGEENDILAAVVSAGPAVIARSLHTRNACFNGDPITYTLSG